MSLDEEIPGNLELGWGLIKDILIQHKVRMSKIVGPNMHIDDAPGQHGKQITIYSWYNTEKEATNWIIILCEITQALIANQIYPGYKCKGSTEKEERSFAGNNYISYRYQLLAKRGAVISSRTLAVGQEDPYAGTEVLALLGQLPTKDERSTAQVRP